MAFEFIQPRGALGILIVIVVLVQAPSSSSSSSSPPSKSSYFLVILLVVVLGVFLVIAFPVAIGIFIVNSPAGHGTITSLWESGVVSSKWSLARDARMRRKTAPNHSCIPDGGKPPRRRKAGASARQFIPSIPSDWNQAQKTRA
jgi:hypothetical protein